MRRGGSASIGAGQSGERHPNMALNGTAGLFILDYPPNMREAGHSVPGRPGGSKTGLETLFWLWTAGPAGTMKVRMTFLALTVE
jgi:hypothetical protein